MVIIRDALTLRQFFFIAYPERLRGVALRSLSNLLSLLRAGANSILAVRCAVWDR